MPRDLNVICLKCLEKKPEKRYATAAELADDLDRLLGNEPILARPAGRLERAQRWARRNPAWATLALVSAMGLIGLLATWAAFTRELSRELKLTELARREATAAEGELRNRALANKAASVDSDLRQLAGVPRVVAAALAGRKDWSEAQLETWLRRELHDEPHIFGMAVAFEPAAFRPDVSDFCLYVFRGERGVEAKQLLPPGYTPIYREWDWYRGAIDQGSFSEPYVNEGGGNIPMVTFSMPFFRDRRRAGVVTADLSLDYFHALDEAVRSSRFGGKSYALMVSAAGTVLSHPEARLRFPAPGSRPELPADPGGRALWTRILAGETGSGRGSDLATGAPAELSFAPVPTARWSLVVAVPP